MTERTQRPLVNFHSWQRKSGLRGWSDPHFHPSEWKFTGSVATACETHRESTHD